MKLFLLNAFFAITTFVSAQNPVTWSVRYQQLQGNEGEVVLEAAIEKGWHTYSQRPTDAGPIPTSFSFTPSEAYERIGEVKETDAHEEFVPAFDAKIFVFTGKAEFRQKIRLLSDKPSPVSVAVEYMTCNDMMCLPPKTVTLSIIPNER